MKILFSCLSKSWGGMEMITLTEIKQLIGRNQNVELLCINESRIHIEANSLGIIIHPIKIYGKVHPFASVRASTIIKDGHYDVIHTHASKDLWVLVPALAYIKSHTPLVLTKHVGSYIIKKDFLHQKLYKRVNKIFAISNAIRKNLIETLPVDDSNVLLLHNGIDTGVFDPAKSHRQKIRDEFNIKDNELLIGMLARFSPGKGHEEFIKAAAILNQKNNHLKFVIVGEASRGEDEYANSIKEYAYKNIPGIIFTGYRSDTPDILSAMDIFVFPSHSESFGIALAEALACGVPSVCSNSEGVPDIAIDNETSFFFETKNYNDLVEKVQTLISSDELRTKFAGASRKRAVECFDITNHTDRLLSYYELVQKN